MNLNGRSRSKRPVYIWSVIVCVQVVEGQQQAGTAGLTNVIHTVTSILRHRLMCLSDQYYPLCDEHSASQIDLFK
jgi:hypothetical protein